MVGEITKAVPLPSDVPPHEVEYHCQIAPVPAVPPDSVRVIDVPVQTVKEELPETDVAAEDNKLTVTVAV